MLPQKLWVLVLTLDKLVETSFPKTFYVYDNNLQERDFVYLDLGGIKIHANVKLQKYTLKMSSFEYLNFTIAKFIMFLFN